MKTGLRGGQVVLIVAFQIVYLDVCDSVRGAGNGEPEGMVVSVDSAGECGICNGYWITLLITQPRQLLML